MEKVVSCLAYYLTLKMEVSFQRTTRSYNPDDRILFIIAEELKMMCIYLSQCQLAREKLRQNMSELIVSSFNMHNFDAMQT
jgi:hypothetical protein